MAIERTLSIIKPDAVGKNVIGEIYTRFEKAGLKVVAAKMKHLSRAEAEGFYAEHRERADSSPPATASCARCRADWSGRRSIATGERGTC